MINCLQSNVLYINHRMKSLELILQPINSFQTLKFMCHPAFGYSYDTSANFWMSYVGCFESRNWRNQILEYFNFFLENMFCTTMILNYFCTWCNISANCSLVTLMKLHVCVSIRAPTVPYISILPKKTCHKGISFVQVYVQIFWFHPTTNTFISWSATLQTHLIKCPCRCFWWCSSRLETIRSPTCFSSDNCACST